jgi:hypothetical protein
MHLKNFSLFQKDDKWQLTPAYDLLNSAIYVRNPEDLALTLMGKRKNLSPNTSLINLQRNILNFPIKLLQVFSKKYMNLRNFGLRLSKIVFYRQILKKSTLKKLKGKKHAYTRNWVRSLEEPCSSHSFFTRGKLIFLWFLTCIHLHLQRRRLLWCVHCTWRRDFDLGMRQLEGHRTSIF